MKIIYVTANLPHGTDEAFIEPEVIQLARLGHEVLVVPRSPDGPIVHGQELLKYARREALCSLRVSKAAVAAAIGAPARMALAARCLRGSRSLAIAIKNLAVIPKALWLATVAKEWDAGHIHCHWAGTTATMTMLASEASGIPWSLTAHRWDIVENNLLAVKVKSASFVRFISDDGLRMAKAIGVNTENDVCVLRMGVTIPRSVPPRTRANPVVVCPARLVEVKGHRFLLEAWRILRDRGAAGELWLAGDGELRRRLEILTASLGIGASVKFLGALPHRDLLKIYEEGSVAAVVLASIDKGNGCHEGIPVALIEAMSYGVPAVATKTGGTGELLLPETGLLVPPEDPAALADAMQRLLVDHSLRQKLGDSGRERATKIHDIVRIAAELSEAFEAAKHGRQRGQAAQCA